MRSVLAAVRSHPWRTLSASVLVVVAAGAFMNRDLIRLAVTPEEEIDYSLPLVAPLTPEDGEVVYRIDATRSELIVEVEEQLAGAANTVELTTQGLAGDVAVSERGNPTVRLGEIVADVHQLRSDNSLRDRAIRHEFLESHRHRQVRLVDAEVSLPDDATVEQVDGATIEGDLRVKGEASPTTWNVDARVTGDTLTATATASVTMSQFDVGPISKVGLVRTADEVELTLRLVAVDSRSFEPPIGLNVEEVVARANGEGPSFADEVLPILESNCASCHQEGAIGAHSWQLDSAGDAAEIADGLAVVTGAGYMPPWPASDVGIPVEDVRRLSDDEVATIAAWASSGGALDVEASTPVVAPEDAGDPLPRPDRVVNLERPYQGGPELRDDYRCFILDPGVTEPSFLTGYTFDPDRVEIVHHAIVNRVRAEGVADLREREAADEGEGWGCFAGMGASSGDRIAGWVPGQRPVVFEDGLGFDLQPGDVLVAQIHYHYAPGYPAPADRSGMTLQLEAASDGMTALNSRTLIGPVELPCPPGTSGPLCDRDASLAEMGERFGPGGAVIPNALHRGCGTTPEEVAATFDGNIGSTVCDFPVRAPGRLIGMLGHMHEIGSSYRLTLNPETDDERVLLDIPVWNFDWQLSYKPVETLEIEPGDTLRVECAWDRRLRHESEWRYIVFAEGTEDEMCFSTLTIVPRTDDG